MQSKLGGQLLRGLTLTLVGGLGFWNIYSAQAQSVTPTDYLLASSPINLITQPTSSLPVVVPIKNTSSTPWEAGQIQLGTIYSTGDKDRPSIWKATDWQSATRISLPDTTRRVMPNQVIEFHFTMQAPARVGQYREYFQPILGGAWLAGAPIVIQIQVGDELSVQSVVDKQVKIYRKEQNADWLEHGYIVATLPISSGKAGYTTPKGNYTILNHYEEAYSSKYSLYMGNWMGLTREGYGFQGIGMHSLAYWKIAKQPYPDGTIKNGRLYLKNRVYEDVLHLGKVMSHGCIRFGIAEAAVLYGWAPNGTPVTII